MRSVNVPVLAVVVPWIVLRWPLPPVQEVIVTTGTEIVQV